MTVIHRPMTQVLPESRLCSPTTAGCKYLASGSECLVYWWPDDHRLVLKTYRTEDDAWAAHDKQCEVYGCDLAPAVHGKPFRIRGRNEHGWSEYEAGFRWGYLSEAVDTKHITEDDACELQDHLSDRGVFIRDIRAINVGRRYDGTLVAIDFGGFSRERAW